VAELAPAHLERELAAAAGADLDAGPGADLLDDALARSLGLGAHAPLLPLVGM
jgi:hypothetical protein